MRPKPLFLFLFFKKQDFKTSLEQSAEGQHEQINNLKWATLFLLFSLLYCQKWCGRKGAGREKTRVKSSKREKAGEI